MRCAICDLRRTTKRVEDSTARIHQDLWLNDLKEKLPWLNTDTPPIITNQACAYDRSPVHLAGVDRDGGGVEGGEDGLHNASDVCVGD